MRAVYGLPAPEALVDSPLVGQVTVPSCGQSPPGARLAIPCISWLQLFLLYTGKSTLSPPALNRGHVYSIRASLLVLHRLVFLVAGG